MCSSIHDPSKYVFRYDEHMPDTKDLSLIVLKGHLLIEEMLIDIRDKLLPHAEYLDSVNMGFYQLLSVCKISSRIKARSQILGFD